MNFIWENIKLAFRTFSRKRSRTLLSVLGIIIGVCSVIIIASLGASATQNIQSSISGSGLGTITLTPGRDLTDRSILTEALAEEIKKEIPNIKYAFPVYRRNYTLRAGKNYYNSATVMAVTGEYQEVLKIEMDQGAFITEADNVTRKQNVVLGYDIALALYPDGSALGKTIRLYRGRQVKTCRVIGILADREDMMGVSFNTTMYIPFETYKTKIEKPESVTMYLFSVESEDLVIKTSDEITAYLEKRFESASAFRVMSPATLAEMFTDITNALNLLLSGIAAISLLVGGIGIMNIMLVSVSERTKEIGIRKAIGAPPAVIRNQFLIEAVVLTAMGGLLGIVLGNSISMITVLFLGWPYAVNIFANIVALMISGSIGIFFGYYPAQKASRLNPVVALSYE